MREIAWGEEREAALEDEASQSAQATGACLRMFLWPRAPRGTNVNIRTYVPISRSPDPGIWDSK